MTYWRRPENLLRGKGGGIESAKIKCDRERDHDQIAKMGKMPHFLSIFGLIFENYDQKLR